MLAKNRRQALSFCRNMAACEEEWLLWRCIPASVVRLHPGRRNRGWGGLGYHAAVSARESHIACMPVAPHCAGKGLTKKAGGAMLVLQKRGACRCRLRGGGKRPDPEPDADNAAVGGEHAQCVCWVHRRVYLFLVLFARRRGRPGKQRGSALGFFFTTAGHLNSEGARVSG